MIGRLVATALVFAGAMPAMAGDLMVTIAGVSDAPGAIHIGLYDSDETFRDPDRAVGFHWVPAAPGRVQATFSDVAPGLYAVMAFHDADGNGSMNRFLGMIPTEGYALSKDPEVSGPPPFSESAFTVGPGGAAIEATLKY
ncbi:MAG: hypothetical protein VR70_07445 [Rhodospirillaceae bacterium BRH_c57]|nr:MAG: hypothetical protein VR70_07445 [Rhodospirillaceae bacterium BRH_c57]